MTEDERRQVLAALHEDRFVDRAPAEIYASLLDEGVYLCSIRTMYRVLAANHEVRERRDQLTHPAYAKPELLATAPNQVWSWGITKLKGPAKWSYFQLYVIIDIFSRCVVGWMLADRESSFLASKLIREACQSHGIIRQRHRRHRLGRRRRGRRRRGRHGKSKTKGSIRNSY